MPVVRLAEEIARRLSPDPSIIALFRDRLPDDEIDKAAIALKRSRRVVALARQSLGMPMPPAKLRRPKIPGPPPPQRPGSRKQPHRRKPRVQTYSEFRRRVMKRALQQRPSDKLIDDAIERAMGAALAEARAGVRNAKLIVVGYDREIGRRVELSAADLSSQPSLPSVMANRIGRFENVTFEYVEEPAEEAPAAVQQDRELVGEWYADGWVPACLEAGFVPSRDHDDLKAARQVFDSRRIRGLRDILRDAREKYAPVAWTTGGPKGLDRKNAHLSPNHLKQLDGVIERSREFVAGTPRIVTPPE